MQAKAIAIVLGCVLGGLCATVAANTTADQEEVIFPPLPSGPPPPPRIALLLPLRSETLGRAAEAVRDGFLAAYERDRRGATLTVFPTGDGAQDALAAYADAAAVSDIVVGPLSRSDVTALAQSGAVHRPTIALAQPDIDGALPRKLLVIGLSVDDEARQIASWAGANKSLARAIVISGGSPWQRRAGRSFTWQWQQLGLEAHTMELPAQGAPLVAGSLAALKKRVQTDKPAMLFLALDAAQARQVRATVGAELPLYGVSQLNAFVPQERDPAERWQDLDGVRLLDLPWMIEPAHPAVMIYPRVPPVHDQKRSADLERLYALGIDAWRVANEVGARHTRFIIDGVSGKLAVRFGEGATSFQRTPLQAVYQDGIVAPLVPAH